jgi:TPR repeat protein
MQTVSSCSNVDLPRFHRHLHHGENHDIGIHHGRSKVTSVLYQGHGTLWNLSCSGWRLSGDLPMRPGENLLVTVTLPNEQGIEVLEAVVRWSLGAGVCGRESCNQAAHSRPAPAICRTTGAGTDGACPVSDKRPMFLRFTIALVLSFVCLAAPAWADVQAGVDAYKRGDYATALREWRPLAEQGIADAQFNLGQLYANGQGVPQDYVRARQWYEKAAVQGEVLAQLNLGVIYGNGKGVPKDHQLALYWFHLSANQGNARAQTELGLMYERGNGVPQDVVLAQKWYILGAASGDTLGAEHRDALAKQMTPAQNFQAQQRAREWKPKEK